MMRSLILGLITMLAATTSPADAGKRKQARYVGVHPVPKAEGGGVCYIEAPHVHIYPATKLEYRDHDRYQYFVGDPVAHGYDGPRHSYKGHHPIHVHAVVGDDHEDVEFCYLDGPHFHTFAPPPAAEADFEVVGGAFFYVGDPPKVYLDARPAMVKINAVYEPLVYERPTIEVEPPEAWIGIRFAAPAIIVDDRPAAVVMPRGRAGIRAEVIVPRPSISVDVGIGIGVGIGGGGRGVVRGRSHGKGRKHNKWKRR